MTKAALASVRSRRRSTINVNQLMHLRVRRTERVLHLEACLEGEGCIALCAPCEACATASCQSPRLFQIQIFYSGLSFRTSGSRDYSCGNVARDGIVLVRD